MGSIGREGERGMMPLPESPPTPPRMPGPIKRLRHDAWVEGKVPYGPPASLGVSSADRTNKERSPADCNIPLRFNLSSGDCLLAFNFFSMNNTMYNVNAFTNQFVLTTSAAAQHTITIPVGQYTGAELASALTTLLSAHQSITASYITTPASRGTFSFVGAAAFTLTWTEGTTSQCAALLGFATGAHASTSSALASTFPAQLNPWQEIGVQFDGVPNAYFSETSPNATSVTFLIPIDVAWGELITFSPRHPIFLPVHNFFKEHHMRLTGRLPGRTDRQILPIVAGESDWRMTFEVHPLADELIEETRKRPRTRENTN